MRLEKIVIAGAGAAVAFATVVGCGSDTKRAESTSPVTTSAAASDEQQIRDLLEEQEAAVAAFDFDKLAELTCTKYRDEARKQADDLIPPITQFGTEEELTATPAATLASALQKKFPAVPEADINRLANALTRYDEAAYREAMTEVIRESLTITLDKVENIKITGDTATADVTSTTTSGDEPPETKTEANEFAKEDGEWKDCEPPSS